MQATPLPNIPLYYAGYKVYSASRAGAGASALEAMWQQRDTRVLQKLREQLLAMQAQGVVFPAKSWPARLMRPEGRWGFRACVPKFLASASVPSSLLTSASGPFCLTTASPGQPGLSSRICLLYYCRASKSQLIKL